MFTSPGDIAFSIGTLPVYYYGIMISLALATGVFVARTITGKFYPEIDPEVIYDIAPHIIIGGMVGARLYYCLISYPYFIKHPIEIIQIWHGGISIHGAILGGLITGILYAKRHNLPVLKLCDIFAYAVILGQAVGRWGNFFNSEAFGKPTESFLKLYIPIYRRPLEYMQYDYFHPTFLYESIADVLIFLLLFFVVRKSAKNKSGLVFFAYLILYSIARIFIETIRIDSALTIDGIPIALMTSAVICLVSSISIAMLKSKYESSLR